MFHGMLASILQLFFYYCAFYITIYFLIEYINRFSNFINVQEGSIYIQKHKYRKNATVLLRFVFCGLQMGLIGSIASIRHTHKDQARKWSVGG